MDDKILIVLLIPTLVFAMISTIQSRRKRTRSMLRREWGAQTVQRETDKDTLDEIALYAKQKPMNERSSEYVDSVTWNDLDMDSVYRKLNRTQSNVGEEQLYAMLHEINVDDQTLERRNRWMNALSLDEPNRMALQAKLYQLGREHNHHTFSFLNNPGNSLPREAWVYYFLAVLPVVFLILGCTNALFFTGIAVSFLINTIVHYRTRMIWGAEQAAIRQLAGVARCGKKMKKYQVDGMEDCFDTLGTLCAKMKPVLRWNGLYAMQRLNEYDLFTDYLRIAFQLDMISLIRLACFLQKNREIAY